MVVIKQFLISQILFFLRIYAIGDVDVADISCDGSSPVIQYGDSDEDTYTLDRIEADFAKGTLSVEASSSNFNITRHGPDLDVETVYSILEFLQEHEDDIREYAEQATGDPDKEEILRGLVKDYAEKSEVVMAEYLAWRKVPEGLSYEDAFELYIAAMKQANGDRFFAIKGRKKIEL